MQAGGLGSFAIHSPSGILRPLAIMVALVIRLLAGLGVHRPLGSAGLSPAGLSTVSAFFGGSATCWVWPVARLCLYTLIIYNLYSIVNHLPEQSCVN